jgi:hypothetical protein
MHPFYNFVRWLPFNWTVQGYKIITHDCWPHSTRKSSPRAATKLIVSQSVNASAFCSQ